TRVRIFGEYGLEGGREKSDADDESEEQCGSALLADQPFDELRQHPGEEVIGDEKQGECEDADRQPGFAEEVEAGGEAEFEGEDQDPERVGNANEMTGEHTLARTNGKAAQFVIGEDGVHAEAE